MINYIFGKGKQEEHLTIQANIHPSTELMDHQVLVLSGAGVGMENIDLLNVHIDKIIIYADDRAVYGLHIVYSVNTLEGRRVVDMGPLVGLKAFKAKPVEYTLAEDETVEEIIVRKKEEFNGIVFGTNKGRKLEGGGVAGDAKMIAARPGKQLSLFKIGIYDYMNYIQAREI